MPGKDILLNDGFLQVGCMCSAGCHGAAGSEVWKGLIILKAWELQGAGFEAFALNKAISPVTLSILKDQEK